MTEKDDSELLAEFVNQRSEKAFETLVHRHINLVYSVALRRVSNPASAQEITQAVFIILAQKARSLPRQCVLSGWLYQTARLTAANFVRGEIRRWRREQEASMQLLTNEPDPDDAWRQIAPLLDDALERLGEKDRHAVILRFLDGLSLAEVGTALGVSEDAAKQRIARALDKLRKIFTKRGVILSASLISSVISARSIQAAPADLPGMAVAGALQEAAIAASTSTLVQAVIKVMAWTKLKLACGLGAGLLLAVGTTTIGLLKFPLFSAPSEAPGNTASVAALEAPPSEPEYQGMTLREWIVAEPPLRVTSHDDIINYRREALMAMGKPAVNYLHWMVRYPAQSLADHQPRRAKRAQSPAPHSPDDAALPQPANFMNVIVAVELIGPEARQLAPDLVRLWESQGNPRYSTYNGFPLALAQLGVASPEVLACLHRQFRSPDRLHATLNAFAAWRLAPNDLEAINKLRAELSATDQEVHSRYALLETFWRLNAPVGPFRKEIDHLISASASDKSAYASIASRAAWRLLHQSTPAINLLRRLSAAALNPKATAVEVNEFAATALDLAEIPGATDLAVPALQKLADYPDPSASQFAVTIRDRLVNGAKDQ